MCAGVMPDSEKTPQNTIITSKVPKALAPKKRTRKRNRRLEKIKLANPGQNARLLLKSPMHLKTFFPGSEVYTVR